MTRLVSKNLARLLAVFLIGLSGALLASEGDIIEDSGLFFSVLGQDDGLFSLATVNEATEVVRYELGEDGVVAFRLADRQDEVFDNPLFCFDFGSQASASIVLNVENSSGHVVLEDVGILSDLEYRLSADSIVFAPSELTQCFYVGTDDVTEAASFGLFGMPPRTTENDVDPDDRIFASRFESESTRGVRVSFENVPSSATAEQGISYDIVIENTGSEALDELAFQEVFPENATYFPAALDAGTWYCEGTACPEGTEDSEETRDPIRLSDLSLPGGETIRFKISRAINAESDGGATIVLYAGAVAGPGKDATFDVDQVEIPVVGAAEVVEVVFSDGTPVSVVAGESFPDFEVRVLDGAGLLVSSFEGSAELSLRRPDGPIAFLSPSTLPISGGVGLATGIVIPENSDGTDRFIRGDVDNLSGDSESFDIQVPAEP